jgi:exopolyphosphatase / guanosine-5'-triphosphate,3'-diphosphate pyrophosphatase
VADVIDGRVDELERRTNVTRLGEGVDSSGRVSEAAVQRVFDTVEGYRQAIDELGARRTIGIATSAVRDAENGDEFRRELADRFGVEVRLISGDEEARLTFRGATFARHGETEPVTVLDIGGGSTEIVVGVPGAEPDFHVSTQAGSVRQTERHLHDDPPTDEQIQAVADEVRTIVTDSVPEGLRHAARAGIAVAGTATNLAAVDLELEPYDPERVDGHRLRLDACERMLRQLASLPLEERKQVKGLHPDRAPTIVAGAVILVEVMKAFGLDAMEASERDILHGAALEVAGEA